MKSFLESPVFKLMLCVFALGAFLSLFRVADGDELIYLQEAWSMAGTLGRGEWFGNDWVGLHGFLFKIPAALLFLGTGEMIHTATLFHVLLASLSVGLFHGLLMRFLGDRHWAAAGAWLLATSYYFLRTEITFLREIPVLFSLLIFLNLLAYRKNRWAVGLSLALVLDAKEHVFFQVAPGLFLATLFFCGSLSWRERMANLTAFFLPSLVYLGFMFFTGIVPINVFTAYILGLEEKTMPSMLSSFTVENATQVKSASVSLFQIPVTASVFKTSDYLKDTVQVLNAALAYFGKFISQKVFGFTSIPMLILLPSLLFSMKKFREWRQKGTMDTALIAMLWSYVLIYFFRACHARYLLPISPLVFLFFVLFLKEGLLSWKHSVKTLGLASVLSLASLLTESHFVLLKMALIGILLACLWACLFSRGEGLSPPIISFGTSFGTPLGVLWIFGWLSLGFTLTSLMLYPDSQMQRYLRYGHQKGFAEVTPHMDTTVKRWFNSRLPCLFDPKGDILYRFSQFVVLKDWIPKKRLMKTLDPLDFEVYGFGWRSLPAFQKQVLELGIGQLGFVTYSGVLKSGFDPLENKLKTASWLRLEKTVSLKNKTLYVFRCLMDERKRG